ncbi:hypothetical protein GCM10007940_11480 [Portibacter lacus]|uniref:Intradiol ring-cleavage dioxygenases domain-containing protein n=1 Tax=Portibacter lacus TaxID=1099794 RepID=A0AA37SPX0_9BACT|nr:hypothetical protein GCM10007940_11480 [Portibacter lacus]
MPLTNEEIESLEKFRDIDLSHQVQISDSSEKGQKLWLCLTFINQANQKPLSKQKIKLYHTSSDGQYDPADPNDESTARLNGSVFTNEDGQIFVQTILPGDYGSSADNRHIHTTVEGASPEAYDIHFKQYITYMGKKFVHGSDQHFLADLKQLADSTLITFITIAVKQPVPSSENDVSKIPDCQWCGANEASANLKWETTIADHNVQGERLIMEGTIYEKDGVTPAKDVIVYAYHTNNDGLYEKKGDETGNGVRHGYLRGWALTNSDGKYRFHTIKPAPYPNHSEPAHIHMTLKGKHFDEYWINATWFSGDQIITKEMTKKLTRTGGFSNIINLNLNEEGTWVGNRDIVLNPQ